MNKSGDLIKKFRKRAGMSQFDLELAVGAASGSYSKIESNKVNPTKETIKKISEVLHLPTHESALLYELDIDEYRVIISSINKIHKQENEHDMFQVAVDELYKNMNFLGVSILLVQNEEIFWKATGKNWYTAKMRGILGMNSENIRFSLNSPESNALIEVVKQKKILFVESLHDCLKPLVSKRICNLIQMFIQIKGICVIPILSEKNELIGVMPIGFKDQNTIQEKLPVILGYCEAVAVAYRKFS